MPNPGTRSYYPCIHLSVFQFPKPQGPIFPINDNNWDFCLQASRAKLQKFKLTLWLSTNNLIFLSLRISLARFWYALNLEIYLLNLALSNSSAISDSSFVIASYIISAGKFS